MTQQLAYALNYAWGHAGTGWCERSDVLLEARLTQADAVLPVVADWLRAHQVTWMVFDGAPCSMAYWGGYFAHAKRRDGALSVLMHSHGQDAFDALEDAAHKLKAALDASGVAYSVTWIEHPHTRDMWHLTR